MLYLVELDHVKPGQTATRETARSFIESFGKAEGNSAYEKIYFTTHRLRRIGVRHRFGRPLATETRADHAAFAAARLALHAHGRRRGTRRDQHREHRHRHAVVGCRD